MVALAQASVNDAHSPTASARRLAGRLERCGLNPFQSDRERYLVLLQDTPGEVIPLGRPLRSSRFFKPSALKRDVAMVRALEGFAADAPTSEWLFWNVGMAGQKANVGSLPSCLADFNRKLNIEFTELRKRCGFELLLVAIHPRYDAFSDRFDLHAHFVCRLPQEMKEAARRRLMTRFSKVDLPEDPVRSIPAAATYMLWGIFPPDEMDNWPDAALAAAWEVASSKARLVRVGKMLSDWRRARVDHASEDAARVERARIKRNRLETADRRERPTGSDRLLARIVARVRGMQVAGLLFEEASSNPTPPSRREEPPRLEDSSSATSVTTQEPAVPAHEDGNVPHGGPVTTLPVIAGRRIGVWAIEKVRRTLSFVARALKASWRTLKSMSGMTTITTARAAAPHLHEPFTVRTKRPIRSDVSIERLPGDT